MSRRSVSTSTLPTATSVSAPTSAASATPTVRRRVPAPSTRPGPFDAFRRLTSRDRLLLSWLAEHYLLSSTQIARALFDGPRTARMRLTILHRLGFLTAIPQGADDGGPLPWLYTLGPLGLDLHPRVPGPQRSRHVRICAMRAFAVAQVVDRHALALR